MESIPQRHESLLRTLAAFAVPISGPTAGWEVNRRLIRLPSPMGEVCGQRVEDLPGRSLRVQHIPM